MDKSSVCLQALNMIGEYCYAPDRPGYEACDVYYHDCYLMLLASHDWAHARRRAVLQQVMLYEDNLEPADPGVDSVDVVRSLRAAADGAGKPLDDLPQAVADVPRATIDSWRLPSDCVRVVELLGLPAWRIYRRHIVPERGCTPSVPLTIVYTSSELADDGSIPPIAVGFGECLVWLMASRLAMAVKHDYQLSAQCLGQYHECLSMVQVIDVRQDGSNDQHPLDLLLERNILSGGRGYGGGPEWPSGTRAAGGPTI